MASYNIPDRVNSTFNSAYFNNSNSIDTSKFVDMYSEQIINGVKSFISTTNFSNIDTDNITVQNQMYLQNLTITGNSIIGDTTTDTLVINGTETHNGVSNFLNTVNFNSNIVANGSTFANPSIVVILLTFIIF